MNNAVNFSRKVRTLRVSDEEVLVSFDVKSLYTSIPKNMVAQLVKEQLVNDQGLALRTGLTVNQMMEGMEICLKANHFTFEGELYSQEEGLAMGSPISPILVSMYMEHVGEKTTGLGSCTPRRW